MDSPASFPDSPTRSTDKWVEAATSADAAKIAGMQLELLQTSIRQAAGDSQGEAAARALAQIDLPRIQESIEAGLRSPQTDRAIFCARDQKLVEPVGYVIFGPAPATEIMVGRGECRELATGLEIVALKVDQRWAGLGHGSRLLESVVKRAASLNLGSLCAWISADNERAQRFFQGAGFAPAGKRRQMDLFGIDYVEHLWYTKL